MPYEYLIEFPLPVDEAMIMYQMPLLLERVLECKFVFTYISGNKYKLSSEKGLPEETLSLMRQAGYKVTKK